MLKPRTPIIERWNRTGGNHVAASHWRPPFKGTISCDLTRSCFEPPAFFSKGNDGTGNSRGFLVIWRYLTCQHVVWDGLKISLPFKTLLAVLTWVGPVTWGPCYLRGSHKVNMLHFWFVKLMIQGEDLDFTFSNHLVPSYKNQSVKTMPRIIPRYVIEITIY